MMSQASDKYKIRMNPNKPSRSNVHEHKDFHKLLLQYKRAKRPRPLHGVLGRVNRLAPLVIIVLSLLVILIFYIQFAKQQKKEDAPAEPQPQSQQVERRYLKRKTIESGEMTFSELKTEY